MFMIQIPINSFSYYLLIAPEDINHPDLYIYQSLKHHLQNTIIEKKFDVSKMTDEDFENLVKKKRNGKYPNYYDEIEYENAYDSFLSFLRKFSVSFNFANFKHFLILKKDYLRLNLNAHDSVTLIEIGVNTESTKVIKNERGIDEVHVANKKVEIPYPFRIIGKLENLTDAQCEILLPRENDSKTKVIDKITKEVEIGHNKTLLILKNL